MPRCLPHSLSRLLGLWIVCAACFLWPSSSPVSLRADPTDAPVRAAVIPLGDCLVLPAVGAAGRSPVRIDPLELRLIRDGFIRPEAGDKVNRHGGGKAEWRAIKADGGRITDSELAGGYAWWTVNLASAGTWLLNARGHGGVYVNGELRGGDPYGYGYVSLPVALVQGDNHLLFLMGRGTVHAELVEVPDGHSGIYLGKDWTMPDVIEGEGFSSVQRLASVDVINASSRARDVRFHIAGFDNSWVNHGDTRIPALSSRRVQFTIPGPGKRTGTQRIVVSVYEDTSQQIVARGEAEVNVRTATEARKVTFRSNIDGSVQYYALLPAKTLLGQVEKPGIVLSLHGASVEAIGQAKAYSPKSWCHIVCPTNRRPFGFDWEDWGRLDALEVLVHAQAMLEHDTSRIWLTGHSMGGHGAWNIGAHYPDRFAAVGPSAGWESFWSYAGGGNHPPQHKLSPLLTRGANPSRTLLMKHNFAQQGVYILHGDADNNVPVTEARAMRDVLKEFHNDLHYHEAPGEGHWWDSGNDNGADCVDWAPMFELFARRRIPDANESTRIDFTTLCPENSSRCHWLTVHMQQTQMQPSRVSLQAEPNRGRIVGQTENVRRMAIDVLRVLQPTESVALEIDGTALEAGWPESGKLWLERVNDTWRVGGRPPVSHKGPHRYGLFKNGMRQRFMLVYGTGGNEQENAWMYNRARLDAETWQYRGNGAVEVVSDIDFESDKYLDRDVVIYGNASINKALSILQDAPVQLTKGQVAVGDRRLEEGDLGALYRYPRPDSELASVCVIGGTTLQGMRLTERLAVFVSGAAFPDLIVYGPEMLEQGTGGVRVAGYFGEDWSVERGEFVWRDEK